VIRGNGPNFELFRDLAAARSVTSPSTTFLIVAPDGWKAAEPYDMRVVRVTGIVKAKHHGIRGNACVLALKRIDVLSNGTAAPPSDPVAVVRNDTSEAFSIRAGPSDLEAQLYIGPRQLLVLPRYDGTLTVIRLNAKVVSRQKLNTTRRAANFDPAMMAFYYRIVGRSVETVTPREAKKWGWKR